MPQNRPFRGLPVSSIPPPTPKTFLTKGKETSKPAIEVITDFGVGLSSKEPENSKSVVSASTCEPNREIIELALSRDRNARAIWQDLVSDYGFQSGYQSVRRFAYKLRGTQVAHRLCRLIWIILQRGVRYEERGPSVSAKSRRHRTNRMIRELRSLGDRIERLVATA
jgi:hypothetical protein